jgi:hypothetical protein
MLQIYYSLLSIIYANKYFEAVKNPFLNSVQN